MRIIILLCLFLLCHNLNSQLVTPPSDYTITPGFQKYWENPSGDIMLLESILVPEETGWWVCFYLDENGNRINLFDRNVECVESLELRESVKYDEVLIYPNPASETLFVSNVSNFSHYSLRDFNGRVVNTGSIFSDVHTIDLKNLQSGIYSLSIISKETSIDKCIIITN